MPRFLMRVRDKNGARIERIEAASAQEAMERLQQRGITSCELLSDAIAATHSAGDDLSPEEEAAFDSGDDARIAAVVLRHLALLWVPGLGYLLYVAASGRPAGVGGWIAGAALAFTAYSVWKTLSAAEPYARILRAVSRGDWRAAERYLDAFESDAEIRKAVPPSEFLIRRAIIRAGQGDYEEARRLAEKAREDDQVPAWQIELRIYGVLQSLGDVAGARQCIRRAIELAPEVAETHLSLAEFESGYAVGDPAAARAALEQARRLPLASSARWAVLRIEGQILLEEGSFGAARQALEEALAAFARIRDTGMNDVIAAILRAYLCLAAAGEGDYRRARSELGRAEKWLRPHTDLHPLLARCRTAIAAGSSRHARAT